MPQSIIALRKQTKSTKGFFKAELRALVSQTEREGTYIRGPSALVSFLPLYSESSETGRCGGELRWYRVDGVHAWESSSSESTFRKSANLWTLRVSFTLLPAPEKKMEEKKAGSVKCALLRAWGAPGCR